MTMKPQNRWLLMLVTIAAAIGVGGLSSHAADLPAAQKSYQGFCVPCHGSVGKGDGPQRTSLEVKPMDFTDCAAMAQFSDAMLFNAIKSGGAAVGKTAQMPAWGEAFDDGQIHDLVAYVRSFCRK